MWRHIIKNLFVLYFLVCLIPIKAFEDAIKNNDFVEVRRLLDEIRIESSKRHGVAFDPITIRSKIAEYKKLTFDDGTEASINRPIAEDVFETDILLSVSQARHILKEIQAAPAITQVGKKRRKRQAAPDPSTFWTTLDIPYVFGVDDLEWQNKIKGGLAHVSSLTCIRFHHVENQTEVEDQDHIEFIRAGGCWSPVGRQGGPQQISIGYGCEYMGIIAHETLHSLGLWHEQARTDRDEYIHINWDAIWPHTQYNFEKHTPVDSVHLGQPYDLGSAMHYGAKAFSIDFSTLSILTNEPVYQQTIGQRGGLSFKDTKMINLRYCTKICAGKELECQNGGYTDPNNCDRCLCPSGYGGVFCDVSPESTSGCNSGDLTAGIWPGEITTTSNLTAGTSCYWRIFPEHPNQRVQINFTKLDFPCSDACNSFLEIKYHKEKVNTGARFCCDMPKHSVIADPGTDVLLILRADESPYRRAADLDKLSNGYTGFSLLYKEVDESVVVTSPSPSTAEIITTSTPIPTTTTTSGPEWTEWAAWSLCSTTCGGCSDRTRVRACYGGDQQCIGPSSETESCGKSPCPSLRDINNCEGRMVIPCDLLRQLEFGSGPKFDRGIAFASPVDNYAQSPAASPVDNTAQSQPIPNKESSVPCQTNQQPIEHLPLTNNNLKMLRRIRRWSRPNKHNPFKKAHLISQLIRPRRSIISMKDTRNTYCEKRFIYKCADPTLTINIDWRIGTHDMPPNLMENNWECCVGYEVVNGECTKKIV